jgi:hypothetical protein
MLHRSIAAMSGAWLRRNVRQRHHLNAVALARAIGYRQGLSGKTTQICSAVEMSGSKATGRLITTLMFLSMGVVLYPQGVRSQTGPYSTPATKETRYCAKPTKETEPPDCSFSNIKDCRASLKAKGGGRCYKQ